MLCVNIALDKKFYNLVISDIDSNLTITILSVNIITFILYFSYINLFKLL